MGAYEGDPRNEISYPRESRNQWSSSMETGNLVDRFSGFGVNDRSSEEGLFQAVKSAEADEITIKQQKSDALAALRLSEDGARNEHIPVSYRTSPPVSLTESEEDRVRWTNNGSHVDSQGTVVINPHIMPKNGIPILETPMESQQYSVSSKINRTFDVHPGGMPPVDNVGFPQFSSSSSRSFSPSWYQKEGEFDSKFGFYGHGLMSMPEINNPSGFLKQDLVLKVREHEEEILILRKHLADYSMKEAQIRDEKYTLEKHISHMRWAFDQQQQDLVDVTSRAVSYRQDIIEENIRLTYALQVAQQERSTFISSLLPLLQEYGFQPPGPDALSIVNNLKILFRHLQEKLIMIEATLKQSQYQLAPWQSDAANNSSFSPQFPTQYFGAALTTSNKNGLEIVTQRPYSHAATHISSPSNAQSTSVADLNAVSHHNHHPWSGGVATKNLENNNLGRSSHSVNRSSAAQDTPAQFVVSHGDATHFSEERFNKSLSFNNHVIGSEMGDTEMAGTYTGRDASSQWDAGNSPYVSKAVEDTASAFSPYLPPVLEEPGSSFSEAADDDPLPAIEDLQITGEAFPGRQLIACGYSTNGTTSCNFEWVRYLEDGSVNYIEGAKSPIYLVTADDVHSYLCIEVQPLDNRKRTGELVKVYANEQRQITCDPQMQEHIEKTLYAGQVSFEVSLSAGYLDIWEPAILAIKREGYSVKCNGQRGVVVTEKFSRTITVSIPFGNPTEFSILSSSGIEHLMQTADSSSLRDTIVLTLRLFVMRAVEKRKGKKKGLFFTK